MITLLQFMISLQKLMACNREILEHDKKYLAAIYEQPTETYGLQQGNIRTWWKIILLQYMISIEQHMGIIRKILAHDNRLPCDSI